MPTNPGERVFTSWKEIASFFGKGVRTVQRWERKFGLPISRPTAAKNVVLATENDLRVWIRHSSSYINDDGNSKNSTSSVQNKNILEDLNDRLQRLEDETRKLSKIVADCSERFEELNSRMIRENGNRPKVSVAATKSRSPKSFPTVGK